MQVEVGNVDLGLDAPLAQLPSKELEVERLEADGDRQPEDAQEHERAGDVLGRRAKSERAENRHRGEGLTAALPQRLCHALEPLAHLVGQRQIEDLGPRAVHRVAERAVDALEQQHRHEADDDEDAQRAEHEQRRQQQHGAVHAERSEDSGSDEQLHRERQRVDHRVVHGEEGAELVAVDRSGDGRLEDEVDAGHEDRRDQHHAEQADEIPVAAEHLPSALSRQLRAASTRPGLALGLPGEEHRHEARCGERAGRDEHEQPRRERQEQRSGDGRARGRADQSPPRR